MSSYTTARDILRRVDPSAVLRPQPRSDWTGPFPLPDAVAEYYAELGPDDFSIDGYGNPYFLPGLAHLWAHQTGYRTHAHTQARLTDWDDDWLVVGDEGADPFIFSRSKGNILFAPHGAGRWMPAELFRDLPEMVTCLAVLGEIVVSAGSALTNDDGLIQEVHLETAKTRLTQFTEPPARADTILSILGWTAAA